MRKTPDEERRWKTAQNKRTARLLGKISGDDHLRLNNAFEDRARQVSPTILVRFLALQLESKRPIQIQADLLA